ncbi:MAG: hypothetical protein II336_08910 [Loktanella sp.]|nr:hypothetical protein [Loktanella sp.]
MINLRVTADEKETFEATAKRKGYKTLAAYQRDRLQNDDGPSLRQRRIIVGKLGQIAASILALTRTDDNTAVKDHHRMLVRLSMQIADLQHDLMKDQSDAGEEDS